MEEEKFDFDKEHTQNPKSSKPLLLSAGILLLLIIVLAAGYLLLKHSNMPLSVSENQQVAKSNRTPVSSAQPSGLANGNSDSALNQDAAQIDSQLNQLNQDLNSVDTSFAQASQETSNAASNSY